MTNKKKVQLLIDIFDTSGWDEIFKLSSKNYKVHNIKDLINDQICKSNTVWDNAFNELLKLSIKYNNLKQDSNNLISGEIKTAYSVLIEVLNEELIDFDELESKRVCDKCKYKNCICNNDLYIVQVNYYIWKQKSDLLNGTNLIKEFRYSMKQKVMVGVLDRTQLNLLQRSFSVRDNTSSVIARKFIGIYR